MFPITITEIDKILFQGDVVSTTCPGIDGELTILKNHTPLVTELTGGEIRIRLKAGEDPQIFSIHGGFLSVGKESVTILLN